MSAAEVQMPQNVEAEASALGCMLLDACTCVPVAQVKMRLPASAWFVPAHQTICEAIYEVAGRGLDRVNIITVGEFLRCEHPMKWVAIGEMKGLSDLIDAVPTVTAAEFYLDIVRQKWLLRQVIDTARDITSECYHAERGDEMLQSAPQKFTAIAENVTEDINNQALVEESILRWEYAADKKQPAIGITTPWDIVTRLMCGLEEGVTILAARPSAGKTTMEDMIANHAAEQGIGVGRVTLDGSARELLCRTLCRRAGVSLPKLKFGFAGRSDMSKIREASEEIKGLPLYMAENLNDVSQICTWARMMKVRKNIGLLTVDFLQLVSAKELGRQSTNPVAAISFVSRAFKLLSHELKIPLLVLSQLSREVEKENREPKLSDLRDSGSIEQDAHKVLFIYKNLAKFTQMEKENPGATKHKRPMDVNLMKHKDGECGSVEFWLYPPYFKFVQAEPGFADSTLPVDRKADEKLLSQRPEWMPADEGTPKPEKKSDVKRYTASDIPGFQEEYDND